MQLHNEAETKRVGFVLFFFFFHTQTCNVCWFIEAVQDYTGINAPVQSGYVVLLVAVCLQKKKRGNHNY